MSEKTKLGIVIEVENRAKQSLDNLQGQLGGLQSRVRNMQPTFARMAGVGTVAFGSIATGVGFAVKQAGIAEGAYNKFGAVFKENSDDMLKFVDELREEMPTARSEIVRMSADLQDLLVPMGLSRGLSQDMTKGFLTLSNQLAAFNDVEPTEVIEAMKSAMVGSSEPLRKFGIDARITTLEATAMSEGLLKAGEKFADLTPEVRSQITVQALLAQAVKQSGDAIEGFEVNQDSFVRRFQEMQATTTEVKEAIGTALLPVLDELLKSLLPIIEKTVDWIEENPELTKQIIVISAGLAGLIAIFGTIGLILPTIIAGVGALGTAIAFFTATPLGALIAGLGVAITTVVALRQALKGLEEDRAKALGAEKELENMQMKAKARALELKKQGDIEGATRLVSAIGDSRQNITDPTGGSFFSNVGETVGSVFNFDFTGANVVDRDKFVNDVKGSINRDIVLQAQRIR